MEIGYALLFIFSWVFLGINLNDLSKKDWRGTLGWIGVTAPFGLLVFSATQLAALTIVEVL